MRKPTRRYHSPERLVVIFITPWPHNMTNEMKKPRKQHAYIQASTTLGHAIQKWGNLPSAFQTIAQLAWHPNRSVPSNGPSFGVAPVLRLHFCRHPRKVLQLIVYMRMQLPHNASLP
jgi:hypothetical protein